MANGDKYLEMKFDVNVISHLGIQMYSTLPPVIAELVSNAYDADAENVTIKLYDQQSDDKKIIIEDDGHGMTFDEINSKFLIIGRNRRDNDLSQKSKSGKRDVIGKKGIGKLSFFGIANNIRITSTQNSLETSFVLNWESLKAEGKKSGSYRPTIIHEKKTADKAQGTLIELSDIKRKTGFDAEGLAYSLAKSFQIFNENDFQVRVFHNDSEIIDSPIKNELRYKNIDQYLSWEFPKDSDKIESEYPYKAQIKGVLIGAKEKTIPEGMRGVALFSRGKLVNDYSFYDVKATSHGYSYITGCLSVDFIETFSEDVISTNRQSLNWENDYTAQLKSVLSSLIRKFHDTRKAKVHQDKQTEIESKSGINLEKWFESLPNHERQLAKKIVNPIIEADGLEISKATDLIKFIQDSFQYTAFKELAADIGDSSFTEPQKIISLMQEWELIEAREFYKLAKVRVETIGKFDSYIQQNAKEVPVLHNFLKQFPWLLDPRIMTFKDEVTYSSQLKEKFSELDVDESNKRIDFLCQSFVESFFIIELKRPNSTIGKKELDQALEYVTFMESRINNEHTKNVYCYIIGGHLSSDPIAKKLADNFQKSGTVYVKPYRELLQNAKNYHQEFIDKYEELSLKSK